MPKPQPIQLKRNDMDNWSVRLKNCIQSAQGQMQPYIDEIETNRKLLLPKQDRANKPWPTASELAVGLAKLQRNAFLARVRGAILGANPIYNFDAATDDPRDKEGAPLVEKFFQRQVTQRRMRFARTIERWMQLGFDDGVGVAYTLWAERKRNRREWYVTDDADGNRKWERVDRDVMQYQGPEIACVPIEHVGCYPANAADFQASTGAYVKLRLTGDDLLRGVANGEYDKEQVESIRSGGGDVETELTPDDIAREVGSPEQADGFHARTYNVVDAYWLYAEDEKAPARDWFFSMHTETGTILGARPNPWGHGMRPLTVVRPFPDKFGILGDSLVDISGDVNRAVTTLLRLMIDAMAVGVNPVLMLPQSMSTTAIDEVDKQRGPGGRLVIPDAYMDRVKAFVNAPYHPTTALPLIQELMGMIERALMSDVALGKGMPRKTTLGEVEHSLEEGGQLIGMVIDRISEGMAELGELMLALDYEFADTPAIQGLWRKSTGSQEQGLVGIEALGGQYDLHPAGTAESSNRGLRAQKADMVYDRLGQNPFCATHPRRLWALTQHWTNEQGIRNPERFIGSEEEVTKVEEEAQKLAAEEDEARAAAEAAGQQMPQQQGSPDRQAAQMIRGESVVPQEAIDAERQAAGG